MAKRQKKEVEAKQPEKSRKEPSKGTFSKTKVISREEIRNMIRENQKNARNGNNLEMQQQREYTPKIMTKEEFKSAMEVSQKYDCAICLQILVKPIETTCGHMFCLYCFELSFKNSSACPLCKVNNNFKCLTSSKPLEELITAYVSLLPIDKQLAYSNRVKFFDQIEEVATLQPPYVIGMKVDFKPYGYKDLWWPGEIKAVILKTNHTQLKIRRLNHYQQVCQILRTDSRSISTYGYHTEKRGFSRIELLEQRHFKRNVEQILNQTTSHVKITQHVKKLQRLRFERRDLNEYFNTSPINLAVNARPNVSPFVVEVDSSSSEEDSEEYIVQDMNYNNDSE